jgi:N-acetylglucosamine kinase-like BadF-type ATPase
VKHYLGVDGGGTKTDFLLIDERGRVGARHREGSAYYLETGVEALQAMLAKGIQRSLQQAGITPSQLTFAVLGVPAYGEDTRLLPVLDTLAAPLLPAEHCRSVNDVVCGWAGALAGRDGISMVAGTGSVAYGECLGRTARGGGWGELFSDEGSAYWIAREGLQLFSRMSDERVPKSFLYTKLRAHFQLQGDLDLCAAVYGPPALSRSQIAALAPIVADAARAGDDSARALFTTAAEELADIVHAVRAQLNVPSTARLPVSYSGGMFRFTELLLEPFRDELIRSGHAYDFSPPILPPCAGAALYAAKLAGTPLDPPAMQELIQHLAAMGAEEDA